MLGETEQESGQCSKNKRKRERQIVELQCRILKYLMLSVSATAVCQ